MYFLYDYLCICIAHFSTNVSIFFLVIGYFSLSITHSTVIFSWFITIFFMVYFVTDTVVLHGQLCESFPRMFELRFKKHINQDLVRRKKSYSNWNREVYY